MHDYDKAIRAALMTVHRYARGGYAGQGFVDDAPDSVLMQEMPSYDPMGNVISGGGSEDTSSPLYKAVEAASIGLGKAGAAVGEPLRRGAENYLGNVGKAFHESGEYAKQGLENTVSDKGPLYNTSGPLQYALGSMGQAFSPLTGAAMSAGQAATQLTGNPDFGNRVEFVGGLMDPSHVGMLKGAAAIPMAARTAAKAEEAAQAVALAKQQRELSPLGFYSHGAETAAGLQQAKGTPQQYYSMLEKGGVKPAELEGFNEAFAGRPSVTREEIAAHFNERMPQIEETVLGTPKFKNVNEMQAAHDAALERGDTAAANRISQDWESQFQGNTKFSQYTLPGGENYREVLLKLNRPQAKVVELEGGGGRWGVQMPDGTISSRYYDKFDAEQAVRFDAQKAGVTFTSQHWNDPNVLAHLRMADRTGPNGEKILHVEEIQSDWGQKGREEGFYNPKEMQKEFAQFNANNRAKLYETLKDLPGTDDAALRRMIDGQNDHQIAVMMQNQDQYVALQQKKSGHPTAPYVTNTQAWTDLALKRALREAAEGGYDKLVWTPGIEQAKRYSLSNQVDRLQYIKNDNGTYAVIPYKNGEPLHRIERDNIPDKELESLFGRDVAEKMRAYEGDVDGNARSLSGENLEVGGSGMKGYYDKIVPNQLSKLVKKLDPEAKLDRSEIPGSGKKTYAPIPDQFFQYTEDVPALRGASDLERSNWWDSQTKQERKRIKDEWIAKRQYEPNVAASSLTITPKMREAILGGQTAFARGGTIPFGPEAAQRAVQIAKQQAGRR